MKKSRWLWLLAVLGSALLAVSGCASISRRDEGYVRLNAAKANVVVWSTEKVHAVSTASGTDMSMNGYVKATITEPCAVVLSNGTEIRIDGVVVINGEEFSGDDGKQLNIVVVKDGSVIRNATAKWEK